jgi:hypothetical protein
VNAKTEIKELEAKAEINSKAIKETYTVTLADLRASKWVEGANKMSINKDIAKTNKEQTDELKTIKNDLANRILHIDTTNKNTIASLTNIAQLKKDAINKSANADTSIYEIVESYSYYLLLVFMSLSILAIIYREVFISGSKQELKTIEVKKRPVLIIVLLYGLYMKVYHFFYWLTVKIVGSKAFNYSKVMQSKDDYLSSQISNNELLQTVIDFLKKDQQTPIQISAFGQNQISANGSANQSISGKANALSKYNLGTVASWFKRSDLVENSESKTLKGMKNNTVRYEAAKQDLEPHGVKFIESKTHVTIKI